MKNVPFALFSFKTSKISYMYSFSAQLTSKVNATFFSSVETLYIGSFLFSVAIVLSLFPPEAIEIIITPTNIKKLILIF